MRKIFNFYVMITFFLTVFSFLSLENIYAIDEKIPPSEDPMMAKWRKDSSPGENHKYLEPLIGRWNHTVRYWKRIDSNPEESKGTNQNKWILGNRFLYEEIQGTFMGKPFEEIAIIGYDNLREEYNSVWIHNMRTGMMTSVGQYDLATKIFTEKGSYASPLSGEKNKTFRSLTKILDNDHYSYEMYALSPDGKEFKSMEILYERVKE